MSSEHVHLTTEEIRRYFNNEYDGDFGIYIRNQIHDCEDCYHLYMDQYYAEKKTIKEWGIKNV